MVDYYTCNLKRHVNRRLTCSVINYGVFNDEGYVSHSN